VAAPGVAGEPGRPEWLSGEILTFLNKLVLPAAWLGAVVTVPAAVFLQTGRLEIQKGFGWFVAVVVAATVWVLWMAMRLQRVGVSGRALVIANYWREARVVFEDVEAVEPVWWGRSRVVRVRFRRTTPFGCTVYYLPKWGPVRCLFAAPHEELKRLLTAPRESGE